MSVHSSPSSSRTLFSYEANQTPSDSNPAVSPADLDEKIRQHAFLRVQLFVLVAAALHNIVPTTSSMPLNVKAKVLGANMQVGSATDGNHAAHAYPAAGQKDNVGSLMAKHLKEGNPLTPTKLELLEVLGIEKSDLDAIVNSSTDPEQLKSLIKKVIAAVTRMTHVLEDTRLELLLNTTDPLPARFNTASDGALEKDIRPAKLPSLLEQDMKGLISIKEACQDYVDMIREHFDTRTKNLLLRVEDFKNQQAELDKQISLEPKEKKRKSLTKQKDALQFRIDKYSTLIGWNLLQLGATRMPNLRMLLGKFDSKTKEHKSPVKEDIERAKGYLLDRKRVRQPNFDEADVKPALKRRNTDENLPPDDVNV